MQGCSEFQIAAKLQILVIPWACSLVTKELNPETIATKVKYETLPKHMVG